MNVSCQSVVPGLSFSAAMTPRGAGAARAPAEAFSQSRRVQGGRGRSLAMQDENDRVGGRRSNYVAAARLSAPSARPSTPLGALSLSNGKACRQIERSSYKSNVADR